MQGDCAEALFYRILCWKGNKIHLDLVPQKWIAVRDFFSLPIYWKPCIWKLTKSSRNRLTTTH